MLLAPPAHRGTAMLAIEDVGRALRLWLLTQLVSMLLMGIMIGIGLWWSGITAAGALGLLGGLSEFILFVGPTLYLFLILAAGYAFGTFGLFFAGALAVTGYTLCIRAYSRETLGDDVPVPGTG